MRKKRKSYFFHSYLKVNLCDITFKSQISYEKIEPNFVIPKETFLAKLKKIVILKHKYNVHTYIEREQTPSLQRRQKHL